MSAHFDADPIGSPFDAADRLLGRLGRWMGDSPSRFIFVAVALFVGLTAAIAVPIVVFVDSDGPRVRCEGGTVLVVERVPMGKTTRVTYVCTLR